MPTLEPVEVFPLRSRPGTSKRGALQRLVPGAEAEVMGFLCSAIGQTDQSVTFPKKNPEI